MSIEPAEDYVIPLGKGRIVQSVDGFTIKGKDSVLIITYGRGVYWSVEASQEVKYKVEILDLRTLNPLDFEMINSYVKKHGKVLFVTEESEEASFTLGLAGRIQRDNFEYLDARIEIVGSLDTPAIPLNSTLEHTLLTNSEKVKNSLKTVSYTHLTLPTKA